MDLAAYSDEQVVEAHRQWHEAGGSVAAHVMLMGECHARGLPVCKRGVDGRGMALAEMYEDVAEVFGPWPQDDSPEGAAYTPGAGLCGTCLLFDGEGCTIVEGPTDVGGGCRLHVPQPDGETETVWMFDAVAKAEPRRFTLAPWYIPDREDAHGEYTDATELQQALWSYVRAGDRRIRLQHDRDVVAGEWVEAVTWPFPMSLPLTRADGSRAVYEFPANTVFLGVVWEPWAWERVLAGEITGYSIGGQADRVTVEFHD